MDNSIKTKIERAQAVYNSIGMQEVFEAAEIVGECMTEGGETIIERCRKSKDFPALAGIAYMMGVNEGLAQADRIDQERLQMCKERANA